MGKIEDGSQTWRFGRQSVVREIGRSASGRRICRFEVKPPSVVSDAA